MTTSPATVLSTLSDSYSFLRLSNNNRRLTPIVSKLQNGAEIVVKLPRSNDATRRLSVGFRKNKFSVMIHWIGTVSGYASDEAATIEQLNHVIAEANAFVAVR